MASYFGGKGSSGVFQTIINEIPRHDVFISAFAGQCSVMANLRPASLNVAIDLDPRPLKWWTQQRSDVVCYQTDSIAWLRNAFDLDRFPRASPNGVHRFSDVRCFVFLDPPYMDEVRTSGKRYRFDCLTREEHERILATVRALPCDAMICAYPNSLYDDTLSDWRSLDYFSVVRTGQQRRERIWMNYEKSEPLHDYRYVGKDKRQREVVRRVADRWASGLERMSPRKREAVLEAIRERWL